MLFCSVKDWTIMNKARIYNALICTVVVLLIYLLAPVFLSVDFLKPVKYYLEDFDVTDMYYSRIKPDTPDTNIILINTENLSNYNIARNIEAILKLNPSVIGFVSTIDFDIISPGINILRETLSGDDRIVVSHPLVKDETKQKSIIEKNIDIYKKSGFSNLLFGKDMEYFTVKYFSPFYETEKLMYQSFAFQVARNFNPKSVDELMARNRKYERISFTGPQESFFNIEPVDFSKDTYAIADYHINFSNKIVLLGEMRQLTDNRQSSKFDDMYFTPISKTSVWDFNIPDMHNTVIQANIISTIINGKFIDEQPILADYLFMVLLTFFNCLLYTYLIERAGGMNYLAGIILIPLQTSLLAFLCFSLIENINFLFNINPALFAVTLSFFVTDIMTKYLIPYYYGKTGKGINLTTKVILRRKTIA